MHHVCMNKCVGEEYNCTVACYTISLLKINLLSSSVHFASTVALRKTTSGRCQMPQ